MERGMAGLRGDLYDRMLAELVGAGEARRRRWATTRSASPSTTSTSRASSCRTIPCCSTCSSACRPNASASGQLGIVLPAQNPIRVAEDIAMLDHMTGGRANAGFARGYQRRWVDIMAQQTHGIHGAQPHQHDAIDAANRAAFEECFRIIKAAWTQDLLEYDGRYWRIPPGETPWDIEYTSRFGGGVVDGVVRAVGVVPKPVQKPHPPIFQPFASSERSIRWCAERGRHGDPAAAASQLEQQLFRVYAEVSGRPARRRHRRASRRGRSPTPTRRRRRSGPTAESTAAPRGSSRSASRKGLARPDDRRGTGPPRRQAWRWWARSTPSRVSSSACSSVCPRAGSSPGQYNALIPHAKLMRSIEQFATKVLPRVATAPTASAAAGGA